MMRVDLPQVVVPMTYSELTTRRVLTSGWLEGEKLSQSKADDVGTLVNVGVICFLKQLLEHGFFHAGGWERPWDEMRSLSLCAVAGHPGPQL
jgi:aarF domain-containing kinase